MAGSITTAGKNVALDAIGTACAYMALYTDDTCETEVAGGSYARKGITWSAASNGSKAISNTPAFDVPTSTTVKGAAVVTADSGGSQHAIVNVTDEVFAGAGTYTVTSASISIT